MRPFFLQTFRGEFGPELSGSSHVMIRSLSMNPDIVVTAHKHTTDLLVWSRRNFKILQEVPCTGADGQPNPALWLRVCDHVAVVWLEEGSVLTFRIQKDGTLKAGQTLNGHIAGIKCYSLKK